MHNSHYTKSCLDAMVCMLHGLHKYELKLITQTMKLSFPSLIQLHPLSLFSHQCDKWEIIPPGDEIFLLSLSLRPSLTTFLYSFCSASSFNPPLPSLSANHSPFSSLLLCFIHHPALGFPLIYLFVLRLRSPRSSPPESTTTTKTSSYAWIPADILFTQNEQWH